MTMYNAGLISGYFDGLRNQYQPIVLSMPDSCGHGQYST